jgi:hypothetical protein
MDTAYVARNVGGIVAKKGPLPGQQLEFLSKHGIPVLILSDEAKHVYGATNGFELEPALPGMVGLVDFDIFGQLHIVLSDGTVSALAIQVIGIVNEYPRN